MQQVILGMLQIKGGMLQLKVGLQQITPAEGSSRPASWRAVYYAMHDRVILVQVIHPDVCV